MRRNDVIMQRHSGSIGINTNNTSTVPCTSVGAIPTTERVRVGSGIHRRALVIPDRQPITYDYQYDDINEEHQHNIPKGIHRTTATTTLSNSDGKAGLTSAQQRYPSRRRSVGHSERVENDHTSTTLPTDGCNSSNNTFRRRVLTIDARDGPTVCTVATNGLGTTVEARTNPGGASKPIQARGRSIEPRIPKKPLLTNNSNNIDPVVKPPVSRSSSLTNHLSRNILEEKEKVLSPRTYHRRRLSCEGIVTSAKEESTYSQISSPKGSLATSTRSKEVTIVTSSGTMKTVTTLSRKSVTTAVSENKTKMACVPIPSSPLLSMDTPHSTRSISVTPSNRWRSLAMCNGPKYRESLAADNGIEISNLDADDYLYDLDTISNGMYNISSTKRGKAVPSGTNSTNTIGERPYSLDMERQSLNKQNDDVVASIRSQYGRSLVLHTKAKNETLGKEGSNDKAKLSQTENTIKDNHQDASRSYICHNRKHDTSKKEKYVVPATSVVKHSYAIPSHPSLSEGKTAAPISTTLTLSSYNIPKKKLVQSTTTMPLDQKTQKNNLKENTSMKSGKPVKPITELIAKSEKQDEDSSRSCFKSPLPKRSTGDISQTKVVPIPQRNTTSPSSQKSIQARQFAHNAKMRRRYSANIDCSSSVSSSKETTSSSTCGKGSHATPPRPPSSRTLNTCTPPPPPPPPPPQSRQQPMVSRTPQKIMSSPIPEETPNARKSAQHADANGRPPFTTRSNSIGGVQDSNEVKGLYGNKQTFQSTLEQTSMSNDSKVTIGNSFTEQKDLALQQDSLYRKSVIHRRQQIRQQVEQTKHAKQADNAMKAVVTSSSDTVTAASMGSEDNTKDDVENATTKSSSGRGGFFSSLKATILGNNIPSTPGSGRNSHNKKQNDTLPPKSNRTEAMQQRLPPSNGTRTFAFDAASPKHNPTRTPNKRGLTIELMSPRMSPTMKSFFSFGSKGKQ